MKFLSKDFLTPQRLHIIIKQTQKTFPTIADIQQASFVLSYKALFSN